MTTNITIMPVKQAVTVYAQDGSKTTIEPQETKSFQMADKGFCVITEGDKGEGFAKTMVEFWQKALGKIETANEPPPPPPPEINPLKKK